jgi:hypothetical protein
VKIDLTVGLLSATNIGLDFDSISESMYQSAPPDER